MSPLENGQTQAEFGRLLRRFRLATGLSQEVLAERARMSPVSIGALERGARRAPYRQTVALLAQALQLAPDDRTRLEVAAARSTRIRGTRASTHAARNGDRTNLPLALTSFHGREREIETLCKLLGERRLVTLCGVGGVGKTRLAIEAARTMLGRFPDGVWLIELGSLSDPGLVASRIATVVHVEEQSRAPLLEVLVAALRRKRLLLILDNCEHLLEAAASAAHALMQGCPGVTILATSREPMRLPGERVERVGSLDVPVMRDDALPSIDELRASLSVRLFFDRTTDIAPNISISGEGLDERRALAIVCRRLEGIPLAIELAAARMNVLSLDALAQRLDDRFRLLTGGHRGASPRQQTLRATLDWSYALLSDREQLVFQRLGIFAGGWTLAAAERVCTDRTIAPADVFELMSSLVEKSLVVVVPDGPEPRYRLLETMRAYALERLEDRSGEPARIARRHAEHYREVAEAADAAFGTVPTTDWLTRLAPEVDNFRAALRWGFDDGSDLELGIALAASLGWPFFLLSLYAEGIRWGERALAALRERPDLRSEAALSLGVARLHSHVHGPDPTRVAAERAAEIYRLLGDAPRLGNALAWLAYALYHLGRHADAERVSNEALTLVREHSNPRCLIWALCVKALTTSPTDSATRAVVYREALALCRAHPTILNYMVGRVLRGLGQVAFEAGDLERALEYARQSVTEGAKSKGEAVACLAKQAAYALAAGNSREAGTAAREALAVAPGWNSPGFAAAVQCLAGVAALSDNAVRGARLLGAADAAFAVIERRRDVVEQADYELTLARLRAALTDEDELATFMADGRAWSAEQAVEEALAAE